MPLIGLKCDIPDWRVAGLSIPRQYSYGKTTRKSKQSHKIPTEIPAASPNPDQVIRGYTGHLIPTELGDRQPVQPLIKSDRPTVTHDSEY